MISWLAGNGRGGLKNFSFAKGNQDNQETGGEGPQGGEEAARTRSQARKEAQRSRREGGQTLRKEPKVIKARIFIFQFDVFLLQVNHSLFTIAYYILHPQRFLSVLLSCRSVPAMLPKRSMPSAFGTLDHGDSLLCKKHTFSIFTIVCA